MNKKQREMLKRSQTSLYIELELYFWRGGRDDEWLPEAIQRAKMRVEDERKKL